MEILNLHAIRAFQGTLNVMAIKDISIEKKHLPSLKLGRCFSFRQTLDRPK